MHAKPGAAHALAALALALSAGCAAATVPRPAALAPELRAPFALGGVLEMDPETSGRWAWSGAWIFPVGDPFEMGAGGSDGAPGYMTSRGVAQGAGRHDGADLSNRRGGGDVRAAAHGITIHVAGSGGGYGAHVVLAHRLDDGILVYSVYGHLKPGSFQVERGEPVAAGQLLGRVGRTGRASSHHLHFEVRVPDDPDAQWQHAGPVDPIAFATARLPSRRSDSTWAGPYLVWAEYAALVPQGAGADAPIARADWWTMLARAARIGPDRLPAEPERLRDLLVDARLLPAGATGRAERPLSWREAARDLARLAETGLRVPPCPVDPARHEMALTARPPWNRPDPPEGEPTLADVLLALADVSLERARAGQ